MSNEIIWTYASAVTLEASGASCASDVIIAANDDTLESGVHSNFPWADFVLACAFGGSVAAGKFIRLYRQNLNIDTTNDAPVPAAGHERVLLGSFVIPEGAAGTGWYYPLTDIPLIADQQYYLENKTDQSIGAAWTLKATPKTYKPKT